MLQPLAKKYEDRDSSAVHQSSNLLKEIGFVLRQAREKRRLSVKDIKSFTSIPIHHIVAIEIGDRKSLPEDSYLINLIRRYARAVGLNEDILSDLCLKPKKVEKLNYEEEAFDVLFADEKTQDKYNGKEIFYLKGYHLYLLIGIALLLLFSIVLFKVAVNRTKDDLNSLPIANKYNTEPEINFNNVDSWVSGEQRTDDGGQKSENRNQKTDIRKPTVESHQPKADPPMAEKPKAISRLTKPAKTVTNKATISTIPKVKTSVKVVQKKPITKVTQPPKPQPIAVRAKEELNNLKLRPLAPVQ